MGLEILKTYKIYIGGQFPRTESGRYFTVKDSAQNLLANACLSSKKDLRNAVVAARKAYGSWSEKSAFNRSQILYRMAEMLEGRKAQFVEELVALGSSTESAQNEVRLSIDRLVYYSGWCDKFQAIFSSVNPVASSHFNFSALEPTGVVGVLAPQEPGLLGLITCIAPLIASGNTVLVLASEKNPLCAISFAEVIHSSDVPGGVVNILTGNEEELQSGFASHMDINAVLYAGTNLEILKNIEKSAADNVKRVLHWEFDFWSEAGESPYLIQDFTELKTTWHPVENVGGASSSY